LFASAAASGERERLDDRQNQLGDRLSENRGSDARWLEPWAGSQLLYQRGSHANSINQSMKGEWCV